MPLAVSTKRTARMSTGPATRTLNPRPLQRIVDLGCDEKLNTPRQASVPDKESTTEKQDKTLVIKIIPGIGVVYYLVPSSEVTEEYKAATILRYEPLLQPTETRWTNEGRVIRPPYYLSNVTVYCYIDSKSPL